MKKLILVITLLLSIVMFSQKNECDKSFLKERRSSKKSTAFSNTKILKTKYCTFFANGNRTVSISFIQDSSGLKIQFLSMLLETAGIGKGREVILGRNIKIAFIFEDGSIDIIKFDGAPEKGIFGTMGSTNQNEIALTDEFLNKLSTIKLIKTEMQNPFNVVNNSPVKSRDVKSKIQKKIIGIANCFKNRISVKNN